jgi:hypothetical protein
VSFWAETRVVVRRRGGVPVVEWEGERHTNQTVLSLRMIATRVFDPETVSSSRRIAMNDRLNVRTMVVGQHSGITR